jgi:catechol 2,3-dioxygenase-like lactoylglutathione lyase family enzyme
MLALVQPNRPQKSQTNPSETIGAVNHISFRVADEQFDAMVEQMQQAKVPIERGPVIRPEEGSKSLYFRDPDGHRLEITAWTKAP